MTLFNRFCIAFSALFFICYFSAAQTRLTSDQKALLKEALRVTVAEEKTLPDFPFAQAGEKIVLYDKMVSLEEPEKPTLYLSEKEVPKFKKVKLDLQTEAEIFDPKRKEDLAFVRVMQINQPEGDFGIVTVLGQIALGTESREKGYLYKQLSGQTMLFKRTKKGWRFDKMVSIIPNLVDYKLPY